MNIGEKIKALRKEEGITQEKLATYLGISFQSVSKWESGMAMPDISLLIPIANYFGVSIDYLLGKEEGIEQAEVEEAMERCDEIKVREERIQIWRVLVLRYPKNFTCKYRLAEALRYGVFKGNAKEFENDLLEVVNICEMILSDCTEEEIRYKSIELYMRVLDMQGKSREAQKVAMIAPPLSGSRELMLSRAIATDCEFQGEKYWKQVCIIEMLPQMIRCLLNQPYKKPEYAYEAACSVIRLLDAVFPDGNCLNFHWEYADTALYMAQLLGDMERSEEALEALELAEKHIKEYEEIPVAKNEFTHCFLDENGYKREKEEKFISWGNQTFAQWLQKDCFAKLRDNQKFQEMVERNN